MHLSLVGRFFKIDVHLNPKLVTNSIRESACRNMKIFKIDPAECRQRTE